MRILLSRSLLQFLQIHGYTHMHLRGIEKKPGTTLHSKDVQQDNYILVAHTDQVLQFEERQLHLEKIDSTAVTDMLYVDDIIQFWVELPEAIGKAYKQG